MWSCETEHNTLLCSQREKLCVPQLRSSSLFFGCVRRVQLPCSSWMCTVMWAYNSCFHTPVAAPEQDRVAAAFSCQLPHYSQEPQHAVAVAAVARSGAAQRAGSRPSFARAPPQLAAAAGGGGRGLLANSRKRNADGLADDLTGLAEVQNWSQGKQQALAAFFTRMEARNSGEQGGGAAKRQRLELGASGGPFTVGHTRPRPAAANGAGGGGLVPAPASRGTSAKKPTWWVLSFVRAPSLSCSVCVSSVLASAQNCRCVLQHTHGSHPACTPPQPLRFFVFVSG